MPTSNDRMDVFLIDKSNGVCIWAAYWWLTKRI